MCDLILLALHMIKINDMHFRVNPDIRAKAVLLKTTATFSF